MAPASAAAEPGRDSPGAAPRRIPPDTRPDRLRIAIATYAPLVAGAVPPRNSPAVELRETVCQSAGVSSRRKGRRIRPACENREILPLLHAPPDVMLGAVLMGAGSSSCERRSFTSSLRYSVSRSGRAEGGSETPVQLNTDCWERPPDLPGCSRLRSVPPPGQRSSRSPPPSDRTTAIGYAGRVGGSAPTRFPLDPPSDRGRTKPGLRRRSTPDRGGGRPPVSGTPIPRPPIVVRPVPRRARIHATRTPRRRTPAG